MKIFLAGGSGTIGVPLVRALVGAGHQVTALTRSPDKASMLQALGATVAVADALDADALRRVVVAAAPTHVIHQLTALPKTGDVRRARDLEPTNRLRIDGTRNLVAASVEAGAQRIVGGSFAPLTAFVGKDVPAGIREGVDAVQSMESQILDASRHGSIEGVVLKYGLFYGPGNPATDHMIALARRRLLPIVRRDRSLLPCIHLEDAVSATIAALDHPVATHHPWPGAAYDVVDDRAVSLTDIIVGIVDRIDAPRPIAVPAWLLRLVAPYLARVTSVRLELSNAKAKAELGWRPRYPTYADGLDALLGPGARRPGPQRAAFAPEALRRASPELDPTASERRQDGFSRANRLQAHR